MGNRNNKVCIICNKKYHYCPTCRDDANKPSWYAIFDSERCHSIYEICVAYRDKLITVEEAYKNISKLDLSDLDKFTDSTKKQINEIINYKFTNVTKREYKNRAKQNSK